MLKWILTQLDDATLITLSTATATKIKGFREITKSNLKLTKPQILTELQKPTKAVRLRDGLRRYVEKKLTEDDITSLRERTQEELEELISNGSHALLDVLIVLMTGEDEEQQLVLADVADQLFTALSPGDNGAKQDDSPATEEAASEDGDTAADSGVQAAIAAEAQARARI